MLKHTQTSPKFSQRRKRHHQPSICSTSNLDSRLGFFSFSHPLRSLNRIHWQVLLRLLQMASLAAQTAKNLPAMKETQALSLGGEDALEKGMATHSSILAWEIPRAEKPGSL